MKLNVFPQHLGRYKKVAMLLLKHRKSGVFEDPSAESTFDDVSDLSSEQTEDAEELVQDLEELGPTFIKLGQMLSTRPDLLPKAYTEALSRLQDDVEPFSFEDVETIVSEELGIGLSKAFAAFESQPLAAASLGQAHRARLRDGRRVVVKVQRPDARESAVTDLEVLSNIADWLDSHTETRERFALTDIIEEFERTLLQELDYRKEAANLERMAQQLEPYERLVVPRPIADYSTDVVLTMEYVKGQPIDDRHPVTLIDLDGDVLADQLFKAYLDQIFVHGFFHADPHPGNVFLTSEGNLALLDLGMVGRLAPTLRSKLLQLILDIAGQDPDDAANRAIAIGHRLEDFDEAGLRRDIATLMDAHSGVTVGDLQVGKTVMQITEIAASRGLRIPPDLVMLAKTLLNLDGIAQALAPDFDPQAAVRRHASDILSEQFSDDFSLARAYSNLLETKQIITALPSQIGRILELAAENELRLRVEATDQKDFLVAVQKVANRISAGLLLASLIVGAALMMHIDTSFKIGGYPGIAMIFFLVAAAGAFKLLWDVLRTDREARRS